MPNAPWVRLNAADVQQISDHLASALMMYRAAPSVQEMSGGEVDVWHTLLNLEIRVAARHPALQDHPMPALELHECAYLIDQATQSLHPWPDGRRRGGRTKAAAFATAQYARCHAVVLRQDTGRLPAYEDPASTPCGVASALLQHVHHALLVGSRSPESASCAVTWQDHPPPDYAMPSWY